MWFLDWELEERQPADWDEGARDYLRIFLRQQTPYAATLPTDRDPTDEAITLALTRQGQPTWDKADFNRILHDHPQFAHGVMEVARERYSVK